MCNVREKSQKRISLYVENARSLRYIRRHKAKKEVLRQLLPGVSLKDSERDGDQ